MGCQAEAAEEAAEKKLDEVVDEVLNEMQPFYDAYYGKLDACGAYISEIAKLADKHLPIINNLIYKLDESEDLSKKIAYAELISELLDKYIDDLSDISVPDFCMDDYFVWIEWLQTAKAWHDYFANNAGSSNWDRTNRIS